MISAPLWVSSSSSSSSSFLAGQTLKEKFDWLFNTFAKSFGGGFGSSLCQCYGVSVGVGGS